MREKLKYGLLNLRGKRIKDLLVLKKVPGKKQWVCKCLVENCGKELKVPHNRLIDKNNPKVDCGCTKVVSLKSKYKKEYHCWWDAKNRCHNPNHPSYPRYGAKGITMYPEWQASFETFLAYVGPAPKGMSLDRIDPYGPYAPENVRWATDIEQARNKKNTKYVTHPTTGEQVTAAALAEELGIPYQTLRTKLLEEGKW